MINGFFYISHISHLNLFMIIDDNKCTGKIIFNNKNINISVDIVEKTCLFLFFCSIEKNFFFFHIFFSEIFQKLFW